MYSEAVVLLELLWVQYICMYILYILYIYIYMYIYIYYCRIDYKMTQAIV